MDFGLFPTLILIFFISIESTRCEGFRCTRSSSCNSIIDYKLPNTTTLSTIKNLFQIKKLGSLLAVNNLPITTPQNQSFPSSQIIKIPFPCFCRNGTGVSNHRPNYTVVANDGLYHIAAQVFSNLVTYQDIQYVNRIVDANQILVGQELWIPLPCSCDDVDGQKVVHYGHNVAAGSTLSGIATQFNTTETTLLDLNGMTNSSDLLADSIIDVPLKELWLIQMARRDENYIFTRQIADRGSDKIVFDSQDRMIQETDPKDVIWDEIVGKEEHPEEGDGYKFQKTDPKGVIWDEIVGKEEHPESCIYDYHPVYDEYEDEEWYYWMTGVTYEPTGFCVKVFEAVMKELAQAPPYEYKHFDIKDGEKSGSYDDLVYQIALVVCDVVIGGVIIRTNRSKYVDFTLPYSEFGISMIVPIKVDDRKDAWIFIRPLKKQLWLTTCAFFIYTGVMILEKNMKLSSNNTKFDGQIRGIDYVFDPGGWLFFF